MNIKDIFCDMNMFLTEALIFAYFNSKFIQY